MRKFSNFTGKLVEIPSRSPTLTAKNPNSSKLIQCDFAYEPVKFHYQVRVPDTDLWSSRWKSIGIMIPARMKRDVFLIWWNCERKGLKPTDIFRRYLPAWCEDTVPVRCEALPIHLFVDTGIQSLIWTCLNLAHRPLQRIIIIFTEI